MKTQVIENVIGQPVGQTLYDWQSCPVPIPHTLTGRLCRVEPLDVQRHLSDLHEAFVEGEDIGNWTYLSAGPFTERAEFETWLVSASSSLDPSFYTLIDIASGLALGLASFMRIDAASGVIEIGNIHLSPRLQNTTMATEAMFLMMRHIFDELGYRRYEWKCDSLNVPSRKAAERFGFSFEGIFRQALVYKGRNRDTAWYSIIDSEWPSIRDAFVQWLDTSNFDEKDLQRRSLRAFIADAKSHR